MAEAVAVVGVVDAAIVTTKGTGGTFPRPCSHVIAWHAEINHGCPLVFRYIEQNLRNGKEQGLPVPPRCFVRNLSVRALFAPPISCIELAHACCISTSTPNILQQLDAAMATLQSLSLELVTAIFQYLAPSDLIRLRYVDKFLCERATPLCFTRVQFALEKGGFEHLIKIAFDSNLSRFVEELELSRSPGLAYMPFATFDDRLSDDSLYDLSLADVDDEENPNNEEGADDDKEGLKDDKAWEGDYKRYKWDCILRRRQAYSAAKQMSFRRLGCKHWIQRVQPDQTGPLPLDQFDDAILRLPNLKRFKHVPGFGKEDPACPWPNLTLSNAINWGLGGYSSFDRRVEALQLSYALRSLGWAASFGRKLQSIEIYVGSSALWSTQGLKMLWESTRNDDILKDGQSDEETFYSSVSDDSDDVLHDIFSRDRNRRRFRRSQSSIAALDQALYLEQILSMQNSFRSLTKLVCSIDTTNISNTKCHQILMMFLSCAALESLDLALGPLQGYCVSNTMSCSLPADRLLIDLTRVTPWTCLRNLKLSLVTKSSILESFLMNIKSTLRALTLSDCTLDDANGPVWDSVLQRIAAGLDLRSLSLYQLCEFYKPRSAIIRWNERRVLFSPTDGFWSEISDGDKTGGICYKHYYEPIIDTCLHYTEERWDLNELNPLNFLKRHLQGRCPACCILVWKARQRKGQVPG